MHILVQMSTAWSCAAFKLDVNLSFHIYIHCSWS